MENFLRSKEYWDLIENGIAKPAEGVVLIDAQMKVVDDQKLKDLKEKNYVVLGNRSYHPGNHPQAGHYQRDIGLHEKEISRHDKDNYSNWSSIRNESVLDLDANDESGTEEEEQSLGGRLSNVPSNEPAEIE
ncbi:unnamed protein product, partial [Prunus brigantina]